jgi:hypothetical protein
MRTGYLSVTLQGKEVRKVSQIFIILTVAYFLLSAMAFSARKTADQVRCLGTERRKAVSTDLTRVRGFLDEEGVPSSSSTFLRFEEAGASEGKSWGSPAGLTIVSQVK